MYRKNFRYWDMYVGANSVDSDQTALKEQSDQDLHCQSIYIFLRHYYIVKLNCFILRTTTVAGLGVPIFRVFTVIINTVFGMRTQLFLLFSLIIHSSMNLFSQHSRQFILSFFQVFEA